MKKSVFIVSLVFSFQSLGSIKLNSWKTYKGRPHHLFNNNLKVEDLERKVFSDTEGFEKRWKLVHEVSLLKSKKDAVKFLKKCINSNIWFLQTSGLKNLLKIDVNLAIKLSTQLLKRSPSLVVRSEAAQIIGDYGNVKHVDLLRAAMYDKRNFRKKQSLWIRRQIIKSIALRERTLKMSFWKGLLVDSDPQVRVIAKKLLNKTN